MIPTMTQRKGNTIKDQWLPSVEGYGGSSIEAQRIFKGGETALQDTVMNP